MKTILAILMSALSLWGAQAWACTCAPLDTFVDNAYATAEVVFLGIPTARTDLTGDIYSGEQRTTFQVIAGFKGPSQGALDVQSGKSSAACGVTFEKGSGLYLVFARQTEDGLATSLCSSAVVTPQQPMVTNTLLKLKELESAASR